MEPIPYYFDSINRSVLIIRRKKPFYDWLAVMDPNDRNLMEESEHDVYLLPDFDEVSQMEKWLKKNFDSLFCDQLNNWYTDENVWPQARNFKMFNEWFDYSLHTMIYDTQEGKIRKDI